MAILDLLKKSTLSLFGQTPKIEDQQQSKLEKQYKAASQLDLASEPTKYTANQPR
jgi:NAD+--asparagine ADP-ribosyltransferase